MFSRPAFRAVRAAAPQRTLARIPARSYAAAAAQEVRPPVAVYGLDGTYASALVRPPFSTRPVPTEEPFQSACIRSIGW